MEIKSDVLIIGGGLAGLTAGIHLSKKGLSVTIIEKAQYPRHKVCGEYISNEILPYLEWLDIDITKLKPVRINTFKLYPMSGTPVSAELALGGFGISRYRLDYFLYKKAISEGCRIIESQVTEIIFKDDEFSVVTQDVNFLAKVVLGGYGKRSNIDQKFSRKFIKKKSPWLAVKAHYNGKFVDDTVALYNFDGGYCGVSKVENDKINICYLASYESFKKYKDVEEYQKHVLSKNEHLKEVFNACDMTFDKPITISQVSFSIKTLVENHVLMIGDAAGLIHPLCGNGMAMAIHSAKIAAEVTADFMAGKIQSRKNLESEYQKHWKRHFSKRIFIGRVLSAALLRGNILKPLYKAVSVFPSLLSSIIKYTHGKPIQI